MRFNSTIRGAIAAAGVAVAIAAVPGSANAAFDPSNDTRCENAASIKGVGASFQRQAQLAWGATLLSPDPGGPEAQGFGYDTTTGCSAFQVGGLSVSYEPRGSGDGRKAMGASTVAGEAGVRNTNYAFAGADEPPTAGQLAAANAGPSTATTDDATLRTIPVAQSAVAVTVKLPAGCTLAQSTTARAITKARLEGAFAGDVAYDTWGEILPSIAGSGCAAKPVQRVVRLDSSGTTFAFKQYLAAANPSRGWSGLSNTAWPNESTDPVVRGAANGAGALLDALSAQTDGGIGYADLASARSRAYDWAGASDSTVWLYTQRISDNASRGPARSNTAGTTDTGANCAAVSYGTLPSTTDSWSAVTGVATGDDYGICALTYALAWERPSLANVGSLQPAITQGQARATKDYLDYAINGGQGQLAARGYSPLPTAVRTQAQAGVNAVDW
ncbi:substrate-binding domain-containing protein [Patulibacter sp. SYSU D01012]|uniref:PstS family phosphate ABC transporter substrate-binding protein n=1 Tax=Patulibacter sp. SYSU D01012 TaxID=2817381 RepID=UPI001B30CAE8|nr:substrate-binding domain-containing protein [Patulibacter sp. SYSU D01012]